MKVLFDHQIFESQRIGGISRYFFELIQEFESKKSMSWDVSIQYSKNEYLKRFSPIKDKVQDFPPDPYTRFLGGAKFRGKGRIYTFYNKVNPYVSKTPFQINRDLSVQKFVQNDFDVFHPTYYDEYFLEHVGNKPFVLTVYDMIHELFPEYFLRDNTSAAKMRLIKKAAIIIAISESTKKDLVAVAGIDPDKVIVTYLGNSLDADAGEDKEFLVTVPERFLLFVGARSIYKNFYFFIQAIAPILHQDKGLNVVCTGFPFDDLEIQFLQKLGVREQVFQVFVNDAQLASLYKHAVAFVFPSQYEGFGIPVLESFSCGCPVLLSNSSSLPEVGGDAALYFDSKNPGEIRECVQTVLRDETVRTNLIARGYQQLGKFSWEKTAAETKKVYESVYASPGT